MAKQNLNEVLDTITADMSYVTLHDVRRAAALGETGVDAVLGALNIDLTRGHFTFHDVRRAATLAINGIPEAEDAVILGRQIDPAQAAVVTDVPPYLYDRFVDIAEGVA